MAGDTEWRLLDRFVLRRTGFPFDWLDRLRFNRTVAVAHQVLAAEAERSALQGTFANQLFPRLLEAEQARGADRARFRFLYRVARDVRAGRMTDAGDTEGEAWLHGWNAVCARVEALTREGEATFAAELVERRRELRSLADEPLVQEALWLSNPSMFEVALRYLTEHWEADRRPSKIKHIERRLYSYFQRLCAKNDTTSFFGPLDYGSFDAALPDAEVRCRTEAAPIRQRRTFFAYWAASALADRIASDPTVRPYLRPRPDLLRPGISRCDLAIPPSTLDPLAYLLERVRDLPAACAGRATWVGLLSDFAAACAHFSVADFAGRQRLAGAVEERFTDVLGTPARRGNGAMFQDRTLLYEECQGNVADLRLGATHARRIARSVEPMARLCHAVAEAKRADLRAHALALFERLSPAGRPIAFTTFLAAWRAPRTPGPRAEQVLRAFEDLVARRATGNVAQLTADDIVALCPEPAESALLSPDVLLAAASVDNLQAGDYQVVLGEIHHGVQGTGWMLSFVDDPADFSARVHLLLPRATPERVPANLVFGRRMKAAPPEFPGATVMASATSERGDAVPLSALSVDFDGDELHLRAFAEGPALQFYPPSFGVPAGVFAPFACFAYPLAETVSMQLGEHTPRIEVEGAILQRERWDVAAATVPGRGGKSDSGFRLIVDGLAFQRQLGAPERVFLRTTAEPKPVLIDFHNFFALELLGHLASPVETIGLSEMVPGPDQLWLTDTRGQYCSELRMLVART